MRYGKNRNDYPYFKGKLEPKRSSDLLKVKLQFKLTSLDPSQDFPLSLKQECWNFKKYSNFLFLNIIDNFVVKVQEKLLFD